NFFAKIKEFRAIATRYDKAVVSFRDIVNLVAGVIAAR
ncbi:MAG: IS5/IS1182 family transposase, partial [Candidatus Poribacteria bacterium]|nr:IS5/IS1182 family transposase [Candidatus Poribacteria bacterium]